MNRVRSWLSRALIALVIAAAMSLPWIQAAVRDQLWDQTSGSASEQLVVASGAGDLDAMESALRAGASPDSTFQSGMTVLMNASARGDQRVVELLLDCGAHVDAVDPNGNTALTYAAMLDHVSIVTVLLQHGAEPDRANMFGNTPIDCAIEFNSQHAQRLLRRAMNSE
jgi:ankyrin repeat protein